MARDRFERHETDEFMLVLISYNSSSGRLNHITSSTEVVAFIVSDDTDTGGFRDTVIHSKQEGLKRIYETDPHFMLLQYLLLFHLGNEGYHVKISLRDNKSRDYEEIEDKDLDPDLNQRKSVSLRKYYCYKIMIHTSDGFSLHQAGRLWQQYVVDAVKNYMIHESCGKDCTYSPCMVRGKCHRHFPKRLLKRWLYNRLTVLTVLIKQELAAGLKYV
ncbi:uncharacterized protein LOC141689804 isoform X3 [Apium graveolens]|uniref:uncharacterized protein LOC141689804 isoform X3 n=1 Tax=Apium graveolens TaxID=4045 RepID=UPI003D79DDD0